MSRKIVGMLIKKRVILSAFRNWYATEQVLGGYGYSGNSGIRAFLRKFSIVSREWESGIGDPTISPT